MGKKIGILTYHYSVNFGANLQAYSLLKALQQSFPHDNVEIIDYRLRVTETLYRLPFTKPRKNFYRMIREYCKYKKFRSFMNNHLHLSKQKLIDDNYENALKFINDKYDVVVVGSDEVWKVTYGKYDRPFPNIYWLGKNIKAKKIAYAVSSNRTLIQALTNDQKEWMSQRLVEFDLIGVRDSQTRDLLRILRYQDMNRIHSVPDPTFMFDDSRSKEENLLKELKLKPSDKLLGMTVYDKNIDKKFINYLKSLGYLIIGLGFYIPYADINLETRLDPLNWALLFKHLSFVITQLFHGTIFSLKYGVPFLSIEYNSKISPSYKIKDLLIEFGLQNHLIEPTAENLNYNNLKEAFEKTVKNFNVQKVHELVEAKRIESENFINLMKDVLEKD